MEQRRESDASESKDEALAGDANRDRKVDFDDFLQLSRNFGATDAVWEDGDFNDDKSVDFDDFLMLAANFGKEVEVAKPTTSRRLLTSVKET